jgi:hypothetical protein
VILKIVPQLEAMEKLPLEQTAPLSLAPPFSVVPYKSPLVAWTSRAVGFSPSVQLLWEQKLYRVVSLPLWLILKIVPPNPKVESAPLAPPYDVVP